MARRNLHRLHSPSLINLTPSVIQMKNRTQPNLVMSRTDWLKHIKRIFTKLSASQPAHYKDQCFPKSQLISELRKHASRGPLPTRAHQVTDLSLQEVLEAIAAIATTTVTWSHLLGILNRGRTPEEQCTPKTGASFQTDDASKQSQASDRTLDISYQATKLTALPPDLLPPYLEQLSLAGNRLVRTDYPFPPTLRVLNLAGNELRAVAFVCPLPHLALLNLANNRITLVAPLQASLKELYVCYNSLAEMPVHGLGGLEVLDASYNSFVGVAWIAPLESLRAVKLKGNPVHFQASYEEQLRGLVPRGCLIDPQSIVEHSGYKAQALPFVPLRRSAASSNRAQPSQAQFTKLDPEKQKRPLLRSSSIDHLKVLGAAEMRLSVSSMSRANFDLKGKPRIERTNPEPHKFVVTQSAIEGSRSQTYHNPVRALMIPPARGVQSIIRRPSPAQKRPVDKALKKVVTVNLIRKKSFA